MLCLGHSAALCQGENSLAQDLRRQQGLVMAVARGTYLHQQHAGEQVLVETLPTEVYITHNSRGNGIGGHLQLQSRARFSSQFGCFSPPASVPTTSISWALSRPATTAWVRIWFRLSPEASRCRSSTRQIWGYSFR